MFSIANLQFSWVQCVDVLSDGGAPRFSAIMAKGSYKFPVFLGQMMSMKLPMLALLRVVRVRVIPAVMLGVKLAGDRRLPPARVQHSRLPASEGFSVPSWATLPEVDAAAHAVRTTRPAPGAKPGWQRMPASHGALGVGPGLLEPPTSPASHGALGPRGTRARAGLLDPPAGPQLPSAHSLPCALFHLA